MRKYYQRHLLPWNMVLNFQQFQCTCFGSTYTKIGTIQRRLAWPLRKDDTQNREAFHIFLSALKRTIGKKHSPEQGLEPWTVRLKA